MYKISNKRANVFSIWLLVMFVLVGGGIAISVMFFYSYSLDVRIYEAKALSEKIVDCLVVNGYINGEFVKKNSMEFDVLSYCGLDKKSFSEGSPYFLRLKLTRDSEEVRYIKFGNFAMEKDCEIKQGLVESDKFPDCIKKSVIVTDRSRNEFVLEVLSGSNNQGEISQK
ncbi:MAG: hypothetical protein WC796_01715 [Candidatus Pacearchaeota archaeon]|jgi:hypothetical protein